MVASLKVSGKGALEGKLRLLDREQAWNPELDDSFPFLTRTANLNIPNEFSQA